MSPELHELPQDIDQCHALIRSLASDVQQCHQRIDQLLSRLFGSSSERLDPGQLLMFEDAASPAAPEEETPGQAQSEAKAKPKGKGHGRKKLPEDLPRKRVEHDIPEDQKICPHGQPRVKIGEDVSEQLDYIPASYFVVQHVRPLYACTDPTCDCGVVQSPKPAQPIEKGLGGPGLYAHVLTSKYCDHLPLYRLEGIMARHGVDISRTTLSGWVMQLADVLAPVVEAMKERVLQSFVIHSDDTRVQVQVKGKKRGKTHRAFLWVYLGDGENPYTIYDFTWTRNREGPEAFLRYQQEGQYKGYLQADAYAGYNRLYEGSEIMEVGCWAHARRKYFEARGIAPLIAHEAMRRIRKLYDVEKQAKNFTPEERRVLRLEKAKPILDDFEPWAKACLADLLPKSPIAQAFGYTLNHWKALTRYLDDGHLAIDNNPAERAIRPLAIGRKNWLFAGSKRGGHAAATIYSLITSAKNHGLDPFAYLRDILRRIPTHPNSKIHELFPDNWKQLQD
jgi:transposase